jgi:Fe-S-cluster containining protein
METGDSAIDVESPCQACGACCSYSSNWPRFTTEDDAALDLIPEKFVNEKLSGMRRCQAGSAWRRRAGFMRCGPKCAGPACPAIPNVEWRGDGMACRR